MRDDIGLSFLCFISCAMAENPKDEAERILAKLRSMPQTGNVENVISCCEAWLKEGA